MSRARLQEFLELPWRIYRGDPHWIPPLLSEQKALLDPRGAFREHARARLFLARRRGRTVGRVAAFLNQAMTAEATGCIGFFECTRDPQAAQSLLEAAEGWLRSQGARRAVGPLSPSLNELVGLLVEGEPGPPTLMMAYNPGYYPDLLGQAGYACGRDFLAYWIDPRHADLAPGLARAAAMEARGYRFRPFARASLVRDIEGFLELHNLCYRSADHYLFAAFTPREALHLAHSLRDLLNPSYTLLVEKDGVLVGGLAGLPDANPALRHLDGRVGPLRLARFLLGLSRLDAVRILDVCVHPREQGAGLGTAMTARVLEQAQARGMCRVEYSWVVEGNEPSHRVALRLGGWVARRYRVYEKEL
ncbi:MAG: GNAT family N-acetyltransferase [Armatimonadetes bacterium]|nr:GNAT family N-acetyltransferase [Armatimonadota bacterium]